MTSGSRGADAPGPVRYYCALGESGPSHPLQRVEVNRSYSVGSFQGVGVLSSLAGGATVLLEGCPITKINKARAVCQLIDACIARSLALATPACSLLGLVRVTGTFVPAVHSTVAVTITVGIPAAAIASMGLVRIEGTSVIAVLSAITIAVIIRCAATARALFGLVRIMGTAVLAVERPVAVAVDVGGPATADSGFGLRRVGGAGVPIVLVPVVAGPVIVRIKTTNRPHFLPVVIRKHPAADERPEAPVHVPAGIVLERSRARATTLLVFLTEGIPARHRILAARRQWIEPLIGIRSPVAVLAIAAGGPEVRGYVVLRVSFTVDSFTGHARGRCVGVSPATVPVAERFPPVTLVIYGLAFRYCIVVPPHVRLSGRIRRPGIRVLDIISITGHRQAQNADSKKGEERSTRSLLG